MKLQTIFKSVFACMVICFLATSCQYDKLLPDPRPIPVITKVDSLYEGFLGYTTGTDFSAKGWKNLIITGDRKWRNNTYLPGDVKEENYVQATGHKDANPWVESWLITPLLNVKDAKSKIFSFKTALQYPYASTKFEVLYSTSYDGGEEIDTLQWKKLEGVTLAPSNTENVFFPSGNIDLSPLGENVFIAFKYKAEGGESKSTTWRIDDILFNQTAPPPPPFLTVAQTALTYSQFGEAKTFNVTTNQNVATLKVTAPSWIIVSNVGTAYTATAAANNDLAPRTDTIYVETTIGTPVVKRKIAVSQTGNAPVLTVPTTASIIKAGGTTTLTVVTNQTGVTVGTPSDTWLTASYANNMITLAATANPNSTDRTATFIVSAGAAPSVTVTVTQTGAAPAFGLINGSFESWSDANTPLNWTSSYVNTYLSQVTTGAAEGSIALKFDVPSTASGTLALYQLVPVTAGKSYTFSYKYNNNTQSATSKVTGIRHWCTFRSNNTDPSSASIVSYTPATDLQPAETWAPVTTWTSVSQTVTAPVGATYFRMELRCTKGYTGMFDDIKIVENP